MVLDGKDGKNPTATNLLGTSGTLSFQVGSNHDDTITLGLSVAFNMTGLGNQAKFTFPAHSNSQTGGLIYTTGHVADVRWSVSDQAAAQATLANIDVFIQKVDAKRADLGAIQNRLESTIRNQSNISENESDARSRIRDTDFASETAALTQNNIIQQASQSILAQANQRPTVALNLLG